MCKYTHSSYTEGYTTVQLHNADTHSVGKYIEERPPASQSTYSETVL